MASLAYNSIMYDVVNAFFGSGTFKMMLLTSSYTPSKSHDRRNDLEANEVAATGNYTAGGNTVTPSVAATDNVNNDVEVSFTVTPWSSSTITARYGAIYKALGGASSADPIVGVIDFGSNITSTNDAFTVTVSTPLKFTNPN